MWCCVSQHCSRLLLYSPPLSRLLILSDGGSSGLLSISLKAGWGHSLPFRLVQLLVLSCPYRLHHTLLAYFRGQR